MTPLASQTSLQRRYHEDVTRSFQREENSVQVARQRDENNNMSPPDPEINIDLSPDHEGHGSFNFALMMIFFFGGCGAAMAIIPIMVSCEEQKETFLANIFHIVYMVDGSCVGVMTLICGFLIVRKSKWMANGHIKIVIPAASPALSNYFESSEYADDLPKLAPTCNSRMFLNPFPHDRIKIDSLMQSLVLASVLFCIKHAF